MESNGKQSKVSMSPRGPEPPVENSKNQPATGGGQSKSRFDYAEAVMGYAGLEPCEMESESLAWESE